MSVTAQDGLQAVSVFQTSPSILCLWSVMMPKLDGLAQRSAFASSQARPSLILTAKGDEQDLVRASTLERILPQ